MKAPPLTAGIFYSCRYVTLRHLNDPDSEPVHPLPSLTSQVSPQQTTTESSLQAVIQKAESALTGVATSHPVVAVNPRQIENAEALKTFFIAATSLFEMVSPQPGFKIERCGCGRCPQLPPPPLGKRTLRSCSVVRVNRDDGGPIGAAVAAPGLSKDRPT
jgi:hypothetical protein